MIRHVIVFNAEAPHDQVLAMAERAQRVLSTIPGVTDVRFGVAVEESARYRYLFDIGFADESVVETYRTHPVHVRFAEEQFRPLAQDRITTDYRLESPGPITPAK
jgi:fructose-bisphosphate aldolase class II